MQGIKLLSAFGGIDEKYVLEAEESFHGKRTYPVGRWAGIAAAICLVLGLAFAVSGIKIGEPQVRRNILVPIPSVEENKGENASLDDGILRDFDTFDSVKGKELKKFDPFGAFSGDLGTGTYTAKKASELISNPPGASDDIAGIKTMPVYQRKKGQKGENGFRLFSEEEIEEGEKYLTEIAKRLQLELKTIEKYRPIPAQETQVTSLEAECEQGTIELDADGSLYVDALKYVPKSGQKTEDFVAEIMHKLQCISGFSKTKTFVWQSYDYDGKKHREYYGYEEAGSLKEQIQNCVLSYMHCYVKKDGSIGSIRLEHHRKNTICLGEYPIISRKKAEKLLFQGKYLSQYVEDLPEDAQVAVCELDYVPEINSQVMIPYYSFLIEVPGSQEDEEMGLKTFARFYVPAVKEKYFVDSFEWEFGVD